MATDRPICPRCQARPLQAHGNAKWCLVCAKELNRLQRLNRKHGLTKRQQEHVRQLAGRVRREDIPKIVGCSSSGLKRFAQLQRLSLSTYQYHSQPELRERICEHYRQHGLGATIKAFPGHKVHYVVTRYQGRLMRNPRWTNQQYLAAVRLGGLAPFTEQARAVGRTNAVKRQCMVRFWTTRVACSTTALMGLSPTQASAICRADVPRLQVPALNGSPRPKAIVLWVNVATHLLQGVPPYLRRAVQAMADFQRWLYESDDPAAVMAALVRKHARRGD